MNSGARQNNRWKRCWESPRIQRAVCVQIFHWSRGMGGGCCPRLLQSFANCFHGHCLAEPFHGCAQGAGTASPARGRSTVESGEVGAKHSRLLQRWSGKNRWPRRLWLLPMQLATFEINPFLHHATDATAPRVCNPPPPPPRPIIAALGPAQRPRPLPGPHAATKPPRPRPAASS
jgi:hypothetical protein